MSIKTEETFTEFEALQSKNCCTGIELRFLPTCTTSSTGLEITNIYDSLGAIIFIVVVVLWYSSGVFFLMHMQMTTPQEIAEGSFGHSRKWFTQGSREKSNNHRILEELADKKNRDKLWDIYWGEATTLNDRITRAETLRIRNIQRQLANTGALYQDDYRRAYMVNTGSSGSDSMLNNRRLCERRYSSTDRQVLGDRQMAEGDLKTREHSSWAIQKLFVRRHSRRQRPMTANGSLRKQSVP